MHKLAFGLASRGWGGGGGTISAEGGQYPLADYVRGGHNPLADYVRGDKICGGTKSAPTPVLYGWLKKDSGRRRVLLGL